MDSQEGTRLCRWISQATGVLRCLALLLVLAPSARAEGPVEPAPIILGSYPWATETIVRREFADVLEGFEEQTGRKLVVEVAASFGEFLAQSAAGHYDLMFSPPHLAALQVADQGYDVLFHFSPALHLMIYVKRESGLVSASALQGKRISLPDPLSYPGMMGMIHLRRQGYEIGRDVTVISHRVQADPLLDVLTARSDLAFSTPGISHLLTEDLRKGLRPIAVGLPPAYVAYLIKRSFSSDLRSEMETYFLDAFNQPNSRFGTHQLNADERAVEKQLLRDTRKMLQDAQGGAGAGL